MTVSYYTAKTEAVLEKYGPGPRVHYHVGFADDTDPCALDGLPREVLRRRLIESQVAVLRESAESWSAAATLSGRVLDIGCGLGGGSIFWAENFGACVTALTNVPSHLPLISRFAAEAEVGSRVQPVLGDAHHRVTDEPFDSAVAIESSCYLDPTSWFKALSQQVKSDGYVFVVDAFLGTPEGREEFDRYWNTRISRAADVIDAAADAGFKLIESERLNPRALGFWDLSLAWLAVAQSDLRAAVLPERKLQRSVRAHRRFRAMYADGTIDYARLTFRNRA